MPIFEVVRYLGIPIVRVRAHTVHSSGLQGEEIQGLHNSSRVRDFALLVDILIT